MENLWFAKEAAWQKERSLVDYGSQEPNYCLPLTVICCLYLVDQVVGGWEIPCKALRESELGQDVGLGHLCSDELACSEVADDK